MKILLICLPKLYSLLIVIHLKFEVKTHRHLRFNTLKPEKKNRFYLTKNTSSTLQRSIGYYCLESW